jgi:hypothetical protein
MQPASLPLDFYRGDSQRLQVRLWSQVPSNGTPGIPYDLTGITAKSEIRDRPAGTNITEMACIITLPNIIDIYLAPADSHKLPAKGVWDLQLTYGSGDVKTPLAGPVTVTPDVTDSTP